MKCINCNQEIHDGTPICYYCGAVQPEYRNAYGNENPEFVSETPVEENPIDAQPELPPVPPVTTIPAEEPPAAPAYSDAAPPIPAAAPPIPPVAPPAPNANYMPDFDEQDKTFKVVPEKKGMSGLTKGLIALGIALLVAAIAGGIYFLFLSNRVSQLEAESDEVTFACKGGEKTVGIITDAKDFEIAECPDWTEVEITGDDEITITCDSLSYPYNDREDIIRIVAGDKETEINVKQSSKATYIKPINSEIECVHNGGLNNIRFDTDGDGSKFVYKVDYDDYNGWIEIVNKNNSSATIEIAPNFSYDSRNATITITSGNNQATVNVRQVGKCHSCNGRGQKTCSYCNGYGDDYDYDLGEMVDCPICYGEGTVSCPVCGGSGDGD